MFQYFSIGEVIDTDYTQKIAIAKNWKVFHKASGTFRFINRLKCYAMQWK